MKNFEKYEKEIKEAMTKVKLINCLSELSGKHIGPLDMYDWFYKSLDWLYEEYKEPLLTNEEREYLKAVIKPFRKNVCWINKSDNYLYIHIAHWYCTELYIGDCYKLNGLEDGKEYSLEELGL